MAMNRKPSRNKLHRFDHRPPEHDHFVVGDDNWGLEETALPVGDARVASHPNDSMMDRAGVGEHMHPVFSDKSSFYIHDSQTKGK